MLSVEFFVSEHFINLRLGPKSQGFFQLIFEISRFRGCRGWKVCCFNHQFKVVLNQNENTHLHYDGNEQRKAKVCVRLSLTLSGVLGMVSENTKRYKTNL